MYRSDFTHQEWTDYVRRQFDGWIDAMINPISDDPKDLELSKEVCKNFKAAGVIVHSNEGHRTWSLVPDFNEQTYEALANL